MIIKYNAEGEIEWAKGIGNTGQDEITSVAETSDGGIIAGGSFSSSSIDLGNGVTLTNKESGYSNGMIIKFEKSELPNPTTIQAKGIGGSKEDKILSVAGTSDGGIIAEGYFRSSSIDLGNGVSLSNINNNGSSDGMIIKYSAEGKCEWAKGIGGSSDDEINSVAETSDGGILAGGYFGSSSIDLGNGVSLSSSSSDGMIIKYNSSGECEWAKVIGGSSGDYIQSVAETSDGEES